MKKKLLFIIPALSLLLVGAVVFNLFIRKGENLGKGFDGNISGSCVLVGSEDMFLYDQDILEELDSLAKEYSDKLDMNICIYLSEKWYNSDDAVQIFCDDTYDEIYGEDTDGVFYMIDLSGSSPARDCISTSGKAVLLYEKELDGIFERINAHLPSGGNTAYPDDIDGAVREFLSQLERYGNKKPGFFSSYHDKSSGKYFYYKGGEFIVSKKRPPVTNLLMLLITAVIGTVTGVITYFSIKSKYKFKTSANPGVYVSHEESRLTEQSDTFIRSYVTKHKIETSGSGGGSSSGGGHSHSGGHGGGVHHR